MFDDGRRLGMVEVLEEYPRIVRESAQTQQWHVARKRAVDLKKTKSEINFSSVSAMISQRATFQRILTKSFDPNSEN